MFYVFFDTECTQVLEKRDGFFDHIPNPKCAQQMWSKCKAVDDLRVDFERDCGKRIHSLWQDTVGKLIHYLRQSRLLSD